MQILTQKLPDTTPRSTPRSTTGGPESGASNQAVLSVEMATMTTRNGSLYLAVAGTHFNCFTDTKVQIMTLQGCRTPSRRGKPDHFLQGRLHILALKGQRHPAHANTAQERHQAARNQRFESDVFAVPPPHGVQPHKGTQFTCSTGTKVQILTLRRQPEEFNLIFRVGSAALAGDPMSPPQRGGAVRLERLLLQVT